MVWCPRKIRSSPVDGARAPRSSPSPFLWRFRHFERRSRHQEPKGVRGEGITRAGDLFPVLATGRQEAQTLSGGERKMLAMAQALIREAESFSDGRTHRRSGTGWW